MGRERGLLPLCLSFGESVPSSGSNSFCVLGGEGLVVCPLGGGFVGLSWAVGGASVGLSLWRRLFHSGVGESVCPTPGRGHSGVYFLGEGVLYYYFGEFAPVSCGGGEGSLHLPSWRGVCLSAFGGGAGEEGFLSPTATVFSALGNASTFGLGSASGPARLLPPGADSGALQTGAPGGGCALCGSLACLGGLGCGGTRGY